MWHVRAPCAVRADAGVYCHVPALLAWAGGLGMPQACTIDVDGDEAGSFLTACSYRPTADDSWCLLVLNQ